MEEFEEPATRWVFREDDGTTMAWQEPVSPDSGWIFDQHRNQASNPTRDLTIHSTSRGRDDFGYAGFYLSTGEVAFRFQMGRAYSRPLTEEECCAFPRYADARIVQIVDRELTADQRQNILEWLQVQEDSVTSARSPSRPRSLMRLQSVPYIEGY